MECRKSFIRDLKEGNIIKGNKTFTELADVYNYPKTNGPNLCKKDYYKFLRDTHNIESKNKRIEVPSDDPNYTLSSFMVNKDGERAVQWFRSKEIIETVNFKELFKSILDGITLSHREEVKIPVRSTSNNLLVINITDVHLNKKHFNEGITLDQQISRLEDAVRYCISQATNVNKVLLIIGHDLLHSEYMGTTTRGTIQDTLESFEVLFKKAFLAIIKVVESCLDVAPTDVVLVNGNHAYAAELQLFSALEVYYDRLKLSGLSLYGGKEDRKYYSYYNNSFMLIHDTKNKVSDLPLLFSVEKPELFVKKNKYILSGHLHSKKEISFVSSNENFGIEHIQCPSLSSSPDKWHHDNMYVGNKSRLLALVVCPDKGIINHIIYNS